MSQAPVQTRDLRHADSLPQHLKAKVLNLPPEIYNQLFGLNARRDHKPDDPASATQSRAAKVPISEAAQGQGGQRYADSKSPSQHG